MAEETKKKLDSFNESREYSLNFDALEKLNGKEGLAILLNTSLTKGLNEEDVDKQRNDFGRNDFPSKEMDSWFDMFLESFEDETLKVLIGAAILSLVIGLWSDFNKNYSEEKHSFIHINDLISFLACFTWISSGWIEGGAILLAVLVVAVVTAGNNYNKESQFRQLNAKKEDITVLVMRSSKYKNIQISEVVVGDLVKLTTGDKIPADGVFDKGTDVKTSEAALTGETNDQPKCAQTDPFLLSGTTMSSGECTMLVTAVGESSRWGKIRAGLDVEKRPTPLQEKLEVVADQIGNVGKIAAAATFIAVIGMNYFDESTRPLKDDNSGPLSLFDCALKAFILAVTIVVVAVPEGLPLAVTLSLAYSTKKMMNDNNLIRELDACETMGNATNICTDKTGTLTMNRMTVVEGWFGDLVKVYSAENASSKKTSHIDLMKAELHAVVSDHIIHNCAYNSTAILLEDEKTKEIIVQGNKTEGALLMFIKYCFNVNKSDYPRKESDTLSSGSFTSTRKRMSVLIHTGKKNEATLYCKGGSEVIVDLCSKYSDDKGNEVKLTETKKNELKKLINTMAQKQLRTICLAHRAVTSSNKAVTAEALESEMTLDAIVGIKDPLRPDVIEAIKECQRAGIFVRMVTGDNVETAKAIATECGILTKGGSVMEGPEFRKLTPAQLDAKLPTLQVLARSSPEDKLLLVSRLNGRLPKNETDWKEKHPEGIWKTQRDLLLPGYEEEWKASRGKGSNLYEEVVGVTGDGTNDAPALVAADVGLSMGIAGTEVAKDASDIVILDDSFASIVKAVMWGRSVFDNIRKFLQFQLTVNVVALTITFVAAIKGKEPPLSAVMMLWVNMIMDTMGALALGTEPPSEELLHRLPYKRSASLVSNKMIRNIFFQYVYQMAVLYYLLLGGGMSHFSVDPNDEPTKITIIFNTFVLCQVFNEINARSIGDGMNVFYGIFRNPLFISIILFTLVAQYYIVTYGGMQFVGTVPLNESQWIQCLLLGSLSLTVGGIMRLLPVRDNNDDIAAISQLMIDSQKIAARTTSEIDTTKKFPFSFIIWLSAVAIIPVVTLEYFPLLKEQLIQRLQQSGVIIQV